MKKNILHIVIFLLGIFYLFSGVIKIIDIDNFLFLIRSYKQNIFIYIALSIPVIEIIIATLLILRIRTKQVLLFSVLLLSFFTLVYAFGSFLFNIDDCGCFGGIDFLKMSPVVFFIRNGILLLGSLYIYYSIDCNSNAINLTQLLAILAVVLISSIVIGARSELNKYLEKKAYNRSNIDAYQDSLFINKNINETILSKYAVTSKDSSYLIFIFSFKCPHCLISTNTLSTYMENDALDKVIGIAKGSRKEQRRFLKLIQPVFKYQTIKYIDMNKITEFYPLSFYVENDTIRFKIRGALPDYEKFKDLYLDKEVVDTTFIN